MQENLNILQELSELILRIFTDWPEGGRGGGTFSFVNRKVYRTFTAT